MRFFLLMQTVLTSVIFIDCVASWLHCLMSANVLLLWQVATSRNMVCRCTEMLDVHLRQSGHRVTLSEDARWCTATGVLALSCSSCVFGLCLCLCLCVYVCLFPSAFTVYQCSNRYDLDCISRSVIHCVPKKHVTTFSTITLTIGVRLQ